MAPLVDVLLPTFCRPHTLPWAIRSVLAQTCADFRLHVIGDGCGDDTEAVVRAVSDSRVTFRRFPKGRGFGYGHRNIVLQDSNAPFVAYMTDDDLWFPDHLEHALGALDDDAVLLAAARSCHVRPPDELNPHFFAFDWRAPLLRNWFMGAVNCVHRRSLFDEIGLWNARLFRFGDREFYNRARRRTGRARYSSFVTVLRFYALHWDQHYRDGEEPPQAHYLPELARSSFRDELRARAEPGGRTWSDRRKQWEDFFSFALRSGPRFARFWVEQARSTILDRLGEQS